MYEHFYNEKIELVFCEYGEKIEFLNEEKMKRISGYHKLLIKLDEIMNHEFFSKEIKCEEFLNLQYYVKETLIKIFN